MTRIITIGEVMLELSDVGGNLYKKSFAGDSFNVAHYINVVSRGRLKPDYLTAVGCDAQSEACLSFMEANGVSTAKCLRDANRTIGLFILSNDENGEKQYGYWRGQSAARHVFDRIQDLSGYELIYFSGITAAVTENKNNLIESIATAKQHGSEIVYDFNYRDKLWDPHAAVVFAERIMPLADLVKISDEELAVLFPGMAIGALSERYSGSEWVLTCGGVKGEVWQGGTLTARQAFAPAAKVVDSSAAGDAFIAAYIVARLATASTLTGLRRGHTVASQVVCQKGSIAAIDFTDLD